MLDNKFKFFSGGNVESINSTIHDPRPLYDFRVKFHTATGLPPFFIASFDEPTFNDEDNRWNHISFRIPRRYLEALNRYRRSPNFMIKIKKFDHTGSIISTYTFSTNHFIIREYGDVTIMIVRPTIFTKQNS
jgi:hypothetical protein